MNNSNLENFTLNKYFDHCMGLKYLEIWLTKHNIKSEQKIINLPIEVSYLFKLGIPIYNNEKYLYIAAELEEINWLKRIQWSRLIVDQFYKRLVLVSKKMEGDKRNFSDIPSFCLYIPYLSQDKVSILSNSKNIGIKEFFIEDGEIIITKKLLQVIPLVHKDNSEEQYFTDFELEKHFNHNDLVNGMIVNTNKFNVAFVGDTINSFSDSNLNFLTQSKENRSDLKENTPDYLKDFF